MITEWGEYICSIVFVLTSLHDSTLKKEVRKWSSGSVVERQDGRYDMALGEA